MGKRRGSVLIHRTERKSMWLYNDKPRILMSLNPFGIQRQIDSIFVPFKKTYRPDPP